MPDSIKSITVLILVCFATRAGVQSQQVSDSLRTSLVTKLNQVNPDSSWAVFTRGNNIVLQYSSTFLFIPEGHGHDANYQATKPDRVELVVRLEDNWTEKKADSLGRKNRAAIRPLRRKAFRYFRNENGKYSMDYRYFSRRPVALTFYHARILTATEKESLSGIQRLPDTLIGNTGVFVDLEKRHRRSFIWPPDEEDEIRAGYMAFAGVLGQFSLFKNEDRYW